MKAVSGWNGGEQLLRGWSAHEEGGGRGVAYVMRVVGGALKKMAVTAEMSASAGCWHRKR